EETLMETLGELSPRGSPPRARRATRRHDAVARSVRELLAARFEQPWTVTSIARVVGVSPFHACRVFRSGTGYPLHAYLTARRLRRSRVLRGEARRALRAPAAALGFSSHSHFTAAFRRAFSVAPSEFRSVATSERARCLARRLT